MSKSIEDYKKYLLTKTIEECEDIYQNINEEKYPDRFDAVKSILEYKLGSPYLKHKSSKYEKFSSERWMNKIIVAAIGIFSTAILSVTYGAYEIYSLVSEYNENIKSINKYVYIIEDASIDHKDAINNRLFIKIDNMYYQYNVPIDDADLIAKTLKRVNYDSIYINTNIDKSKMIEFGYYALNKKNSIITNEQQLNSKLTVPVIRFIVSLVFIIALIFLRKWPNRQ